MLGFVVTTAIVIHLFANYANSSDVVQAIRARGKQVGFYTSGEPAGNGALNVEAYTKGLVGFHDACDPWPVEWDGSFDWLFTTDMVEHIPAACEPNFLDMLRSVPTKGIILSWDSRYEMVHHPNARTNVYVQEAIETLGYNFSDKLSTELRGSLDTFKDRTSNMFVFLKTKASVRK